MITRNCLVLACLLAAAAAAACSNEATTTTSSRITCATTPDCASRGGLCVAGECRADNECALDSDCSSGQSCVADADFGGLCTAAGQPAAPQPAWSCAYGKDCPAGQGCGSDGTCHSDGECHNTWQPSGLLEGDCQGADEICAASLDPLAGFCTSGRGGPDPYCRSTGGGECRHACATVDDCGTGDSCVAGFCHGADECATTADCSPNHVCGNPPNWDDYGYQFCLVDDNPQCVPDGPACRLACATDSDCLNGGGCGVDGLCHASNECATTADCPTGQQCYPSSEWGGLCGGPPHQ